MTNENAKAAAGQKFTFKHQGKTYSLPSAQAAMERVEAGTFIDAIMSDDQMAQVRLGLTLLLKSGVSENVVAAIRSLPMARFTQLLNDWMNADGANPGE